MHARLNRRQFFGVTAAAVAVPAGLDLTVAAADEGGASGGDGHRVGGFYVGVQCWTFRQFSVLEAIEMNARAGGKVIEFFPGQRFRADEDGNWGHDSGEEQRKIVKERLEEFGTRAMNYGVVGVPDEEEGARKIFEFAKEFGMMGITTESVGSLDLMGKLAEEYDLKVCIHNHPERPDDPNYRVWNPAYVMEYVKDRHPNLGACADTGHWIRSGLDPMECLEILKGRVYSTHFKDRLEPGGPDQVFGVGAASLPAQLEWLREQGFEGNVSIEYETNWDASLPDVAQCVGYIRGLGIAKGWG
jgi:sugar phosphate isomerase/epimerase